MEKTEFRSIHSIVAKASISKRKKNPNTIKVRKSLDKALRFALCLTLLLHGWLLCMVCPVVAEVKTGAVQPSAQSAGTQLPSVPAKADGSAVIDFAKLAAQEASKPAPTGPPVPQVIHSPVTPPEVDAPVPGKGQEAPIPPAAPPGPAAPSPSPTSNFIGMTDIPKAGTSSIVIPPDTTGAVGLTDIFETVNNNYVVQNKTTGALGTPVSIDTFWTATGGSGPFDPRTLYDPFNNRWLVCCVSNAVTAASSILVGISNTANPAGTYTLFRVDADNGGTTQWADFPTMGFNNNWVSINVNMININNGMFVTGRNLVIDYAMLRGGTFSGVFIVGTGFVSSPAITYDPTQTTLFVPTHLSSVGATYRLDTITGTPPISAGNPVYTVGATMIRTGGAWVNPGGQILPQAAPLAGASACGATPCPLETQDAQIRSNPIYRGGNIFYAQTVGLPAGGLTHTAAQWTKINTLGTFVDGGRVDDPTATSTNGGKWYAYTSLSVNQRGDVLLGFSQFASNQFPSAGYTFRDTGDAPGTMRDPFIYKAGEDYYHKTFTNVQPRNRWGDYSMTQVDPSNDFDMWTLQEYGMLRVGTDDGNTGSNSSRWSTWWAKLSLGPTLAKIRNFNARGYDDGRILLQWTSGYESGNLGYNVYRESNGQRTKLNTQIIAGSALISGPKIALTAGKSYAWADQSAPNGTRYWLEDIDLNGKSSWTGPAVINAKTGQAPTIEQSALLTRIGMASTQMSTGQGSVPVERMAEIAIATPDASGVQNDIAGQPAVKLSVKREGWYLVSQPELIAAGLNPNADPRNLQMYIDGRQVPIIVNGELDGNLGASDSVEFYGVGLNSAATDTHVYWLVVGGQRGTRIKSLNTAGGPASLGNFIAGVERKDRTLYFSALRNGEAENFFGPVVSPTQIDQSLTLTNLASTSAPAGLDVYLQGVTQGAHQARVTLNGTVLGMVTFNGQERGKASFPVPQSLLHEGANSVQLVALAGSSDISLVDTIRISYTHTLMADNNLLRVSVKGGQPVTIGGFTSADIRVMDVTDANNPQELKGVISGAKTAASISLTPPGIGSRSLLAFTAARATTAPSKANIPSNWHQDGLQYDYVMITTQELKQSLNPLKALRESQGLSAVVVDVEDLYDEFSFGNKSAQAVKDFLRFTRDNWRQSPRFVLFAGDSSYDPKNYLGFGDFDLVPTKLYDSVYMEAASDDWFVDFQSTGLPDIASGRLPVRNATEASAMVAKILRYESSSGSNSVLLAADLNDGHNFAAVSAGLRALLPASMQVQDIVRGTADDATIKSQILAAINAGKTMINYNGHGSVNLWRGDILTNDDAPTLTNQNLSFFLMMTCLNGYFDDPVLDSLAESLLKASNGASAVWASSAQCEPGQQEVLNYELYRLLFGPNQLSIGEAAARAKQAVTDPDVRRSWILFGDPAMRLR